jgi:hypothetical protein
LSIADKFLDENSDNLYGEPHPSRMGVRHARRIVVKARSCLLTSCTLQLQGLLATARPAHLQDARSSK